jgi:hypothetical protein
MVMLPVWSVVLVCMGYSLKACLKDMCMVRLFLQSMNRKGPLGLDSLFVFTLKYHLAALKFGSCFAFIYLSYLQEACKNV